MTLIVKSDNNTGALKNLNWMKRAISMNRSSIGNQQYINGLNEIKRVRHQIMYHKKRGEQVRQFSINL